MMTIKKWGVTYLYGNITFDEVVRNTNFFITNSVNEKSPKKQKPFFEFKEDNKIQTNFFQLICFRHFIAFLKWFSVSYGILEKIESVVNLWIIRTFNDGNYTVFIGKFC